MRWSIAANFSLTGHLVFFVFRLRIRNRSYRSTSIEVTTLPSFQFLISQDLHLAARVELSLK
jgi:hypothetical protein